MANNFLIVFVFLPCVFSLGLRLGGRKEISIYDPVVQQIAKSSCAYLDSVEGKNQKSMLAGVTRATKQVVAGMNYEIFIKRAITSCSSNSLDGCDIQIIQACKITAFVNLKNETSITNHKCADESNFFENENHNDIIAGGISEGDTGSEDVQKAAQFATVEISERSNSMWKSLLVQVKKVSKQVVAGIRYRMKILIGETKCRKNAPVTQDHCALSDERRGQVCFIDVVDKAWMNPRYYLQQFRCSPFVGIDLQRNKRDVSIVEMDQEINKAPRLELDKYLNQFAEFKAKFGKKYETEAIDSKRFGIFVKNMKKVEELRRTEQGTARYGATEFADLTYEEFRKIHTGFRPDLQTEELPMAETTNMADTPTEFDWRTKNAVSEVKNQGSCGSCWAFSTTGNIEGQWSIKKKKLVSLSEQELVDCDKVDQGCNGGLPSQAYKEIIRLGGLETEKEYPYEGRGEKCEFVKSDVRAYINSSTAISSDEAQMASWLAVNGPISIGINANAMQFYFGGISHPWKIFCNPNNLDHGVLIVGYGVQNGTPYWIIKNSWGPSWGEKGYYLAYRGGGVCGLNKMPTSAIVL